MTQVQPQITNAIDRLRAHLFEAPQPPENWREAWRDIRWLIGLDIGGGNCSASILRLDSFLPGGEAPDPEVMVLDAAGSESVHSVIGYANDEVLIGLSAINKPDAELYQNFKECPSRVNLMVELGSGRTRGQVMKDFIRVFFDALCAANHLSPEDRKHMLLAVGHPSKEEWRMNAGNLGQCVREATGVERVLTIPESQAAILFSQYRFGSNLAHNTLVLDLGAFSADATYLYQSGGHKIARDLSCYLGGSAVDRALADLVLKATGVDRDELDEPFTVFQFEMRLVKESYFRSLRNDGTHFLDTCVVQCRDGRVIEYKLKPSDINAAIEQCDFGVAMPDEAGKVMRSWRGHLGAFLSYIDRELIKDGVVMEHVILTGGAANMTQARQDAAAFARAHWGTKDEPVIVDDCVSEAAYNASVAAGTVLYVCKAFSVLAEIPTLEEKIKARVQSDLIPELCKELAERCYARLSTDIIIPEAGKWAQGERERSRQELLDSLQTAMTTPGWKNAMRQCTEGAVRFVCELHGEGLREDISAFLQRLYGSEIQQSSVDSRQVLDQALTLFDDKLSNIITNAVSDIDMTGLISKILYYLFFPILVIIGGMVSLWERILGGSDPEEGGKENRQDNGGSQQQLEEMLPLKDRKIIAHKLIYDGDTRGKVVKQLRGTLLTAFGEQCGKDGLGFPDSIISQMAAAIENAIYCA